MMNRIGRFSILALAGLMTLITLFPSAASAAWKTSIVDGKSFGDFYPKALTLEKGSNLPHIAYGGSHLFHAFFDGSSWKKEVVDYSPSVGLYASIAMDSNNKIHISYYDATNSSLKYATNTSGSWVKVTVDTGGVGEFSSIAMDSNDKVHISYYDAASGSLKYVTNEAGSWVKTVVDTSWGVGIYSAIALDSNNKAHISYYDAPHEALKYATNKSGPWVISTLETGRVGQNTSIAVDSLNKVHISYGSGTGGISGPNCTLRYTTNKSGIWKTSVIDTVDMFGVTSITMDSSNKVHIGYVVALHSGEGIENYLKYATNESGTWVKATIASGTLGYASITADSNKKIHLSYLDNAKPGGPQIRYATNSTGGWMSSFVDGEAITGVFTSLALDSNSKAHISYSDGFNGDLKYATNKSGKWVKTAIESNGVFTYTSIAIDSRNKVHISYRDIYGTLKYATNKSGVWVKKTLDSGGAGEYLSIAIDSGNKVHISYHDRTNMALKYATNESGKWLISTVDTGNVGEYSSIAIDSSDKVHISYAYTKVVEFPDHSISVTGHLKYATNKSGAWARKTLDNSENAGEFSSIAIDSKDKVHISYYDAANHALKYAANESGLWLTSVIDSTQYLAPESSSIIGVSYFSGDTSIALDSHDKVHISYFSGSLGDSSLKYATNSSGAWLTSPIDSSGNAGKYPSIAIDYSDSVHISYYDMSGCLKYATDAY